MRIVDAARLAEQHRHTGILLDANLLLMLLIGTLDEKLISKFQRTSAYDIVDFRFIGGLLGEKPALVTTPHVATEVSNLGGKLTGAHHREFLHLLANFLKVASERRMESKLIAEAAEYPRLGLTDAGLLQLNRRPPLVVTDDLGLAVALENRQRPVILYGRLIEELRGGLS